MKAFVQGTSEELDKKGQQYFQALRHKREEGPSRDKQKALAVQERRPDEFQKLSFME